MTVSPADYTTWSFPFSRDEWEQTPPAVRDHLVTLQQHLSHLQKQVDALESRLNQTSKTSNKPPSSDSPFTKPKPRTFARKRGAQKGHTGSGPTLLSATEVRQVSPAPCACGALAVEAAMPYHTHQVVELPPIAMEVTHFVLHQGHCVGCGRLLKAEVPSAYTTGYGPRLTALIGELSGPQRDSRSAVQEFCASVLGVHLSRGAIQRAVDRVSEALEPCYDAIAAKARAATVNYIDETPWYQHGVLAWLWVMVNPTVAFFTVHANRSQVAFGVLVERWAGILVSDGYAVYRQWMHGRQACLAHHGDDARPDDPLEAAEPRRRSSVARHGAGELE
jgi:transposase